VSDPICSACGSSLVVGQKFCSECGSELPQETTTDHETSALGASNDALESCVSCGTRFEPKAQFCHVCGSSARKSKADFAQEPVPIAPHGTVNDSTNAGAAAGFLGALWGGSASCGCGCFSLIFLAGLLLMVGAFL